MRAENRLYDQLSKFNGMPLNQQAGHVFPFLNPGVGEVSLGDINHRPPRAYKYVATIPPDIVGREGLGYIIGTQLAYANSRLTELWRTLFLMDMQNQDIFASISLLQRPYSTQFGIVARDFKGATNYFPSQSRLTYNRDDDTTLRDMLPDREIILHLGDAYQMQISSSEVEVHIGDTPLMHIPLDASLAPPRFYGEGRNNTAMIF